MPALCKTNHAVIFGVSLNSIILSEFKPTSMLYMPCTLTSRSYGYTVEESTTKTNGEGCRQRSTNQSEAVSLRSTKDYVKNAVQQMNTASTTGKVEVKQVDITTLLAESDSSSRHFRQSDEYN